MRCWLDLKIRSILRHKRASTGCIKTAGKILAGKKGVSNIGTFGEPSFVFPCQHGQVVVAIFAGCPCPPDGYVRLFRSECKCFDHLDCSSLAPIASIYNCRAF